MPSLFLRSKQQLYNREWRKAEENPTVFTLGKSVEDFLEITSQHIKIKRKSRAFKGMATSHW